jgi:hypothetical protein
MSEIRVAYPTKQIKYSGFFDVTKVHQFIFNWCGDHGFDFVEELTAEKVYKTEKQINYKYTPYKKFTDFAKVVIHLKVLFEHVQKVNIEIDGIKKQMSKGDITFVMTGYVETDYENKWETTPLYYFLKTVFEKFVFGSHDKYYLNYTVKECRLLHEEFKAHLNMHRYTV